jgi:hypothetical protein
MAASASAIGETIAEVTSTSPSAAVRVVSYAIVGAFVLAVPGLIASETVLAPGWEAGWRHFGNGLASLVLGVVGGASGAIVGVLIARRQLRQQGGRLDDPPPMLSLPAMGVLGAFLGSVVAGGLWGAVVVGVLLLIIGVLAAQ